MLALWKGWRLLQLPSRDKNAVFPVLQQSVNSILSGLATDSIFSITGAFDGYLNILASTCDVEKIVV